MNYTTFAQLYDQLMDPEIYESWLEYFKQRVSPNSGMVLDLGCGAGALTMQLKKAGFQMEGLDLSDEMLSLASERMSRANVFFPVYQADMTDLNGLGQYAVVVSTLDSLCYLANFAELGKVFREVYAHLKEHGKFLFDVHSVYQMEKVFPDYMYNYQDQNEAFLWHSYPTDVSYGIEHELTFFIKDQATKNYQRLTEHHYERTYPLANYIDLLKEVGFKKVEVKADFGRFSVKNDSTRWFFCCDK